MLTQDNSRFRTRTHRFSLPICILIAVASLLSCGEYGIIDPAPEDVPITTSVSFVTVDSLLQGVPTTWAHITWSGSHAGGVATDFVYALLSTPDTMTTCADMWNPATNAEDLAAATATTDTELWVRLKQPGPAPLATAANDAWTFVVAAMDDDGLIDLTSDCVELGERQFPEAPTTGVSVTLVDSLVGGEPTRWAHVSLSGTDADGVVADFIYIIVNGPHASLECGDIWNPESNPDDLIAGTVTTETDQWIRLPDANPASAALPSNDWMFLAVARDNEGLLDPSPACTLIGARYFEPPIIYVTQYIEGVASPGNPTAQDTVGYMKPFGFSYHGLSPNGAITEYFWDFLSSVIQLPGAGEWTSDVSDTMRTFANTGAETFPPGTLTMFAKCGDVVGQESAEVQAAVRVNFDPDTRFLGITNTYYIGQQAFVRQIDFNDAVPDTVPYGSWIRLRYQGWDDSRDGTACQPLNPDRCLNFQVSYARDSSRIPGAVAQSGWLPQGGQHDTDPFSAADSNSINVNSLEYVFQARTIDEAGTPDGTPPSVSIVGNYAPVLKTVSLEDHFSNQVDASGTVVDTLTWNFWKGVGWPYTAITDTIDFDVTPPVFKKTFEWRLSATGADHPLEPNRGVRAWQYHIMDDQGRFWPLVNGDGSWHDGVNVDIMDDTFRLTFTYPSFFDPAGGDPNGDTVFANLPGYFNRDLTVVALRGRDTGVNEPVFKQYVFLGVVPYGEPASNGQVEKVLINAYPSEDFGRWTEARTFTFHFRMVR